jgi:hypothetical protein
MNPHTHNKTSLLPWKLYLTITVESLLTFYIATFCVAMFFIHHGTNWIIPGIFLGLLYAFVIFACSKRVIQSLPLPALMLIIPLAPLIAIIIIVSLIPVLQNF